MSGPKKRTIVSRDEWVKAGYELKENEQLVRDYEGVFKTLDSVGEDEPIEFVLNSGKADRYGDIVEVEGFDLGNYEKNSIVLWMHNQSFFAGSAPFPNGGAPIGKGVNVRVEDGNLVGGVKFYQEVGAGVSEAAKFINTIHQMVLQKFLNAVSVGFSPEEFEQDEEDYSYHFLTQELLEFSIVPIPADSDALRLAYTAGIDVKPIQAWARKALEADGNIVSISKEKLESVVRGLGYSRGLRFFDLSSGNIKNLVQKRVKATSPEVGELVTKMDAMTEELESVYFMNSMLQDEVDEYKALQDEVDSSGDDGVDPVVQSSDGEAVLEPEVVEKEATYLIDPDQLTAQICQEVDEVKTLFTRVTGQVI